MGTNFETEGERVLTEGEYALRVYRVIEVAAAAGQRAPSHDDIAEKAKMPRGSLRRIIAKLVSTGLVEIRADGRAQYRRAYRIVETGARTKGFDEGPEVGPRPPAAELVIEVLRAAHGRRAPTLTELTRRAHLALSVVSKAIDQLKDEGRLEVRADARCGRRRCYHVVETGEKTEGFDKGLELRPAKRQAASATSSSAVVPAFAQRPKKQQRDCLSCRRPFVSEGAHNRMCGECRRGERIYDGDRRMAG